MFYSCSLAECQVTPRAGERDVSFSLPNISKSFQNVASYKPEWERLWILNLRVNIKTMNFSNLHVLEVIVFLSVAEIPQTPYDRS